MTGEAYHDLLRRLADRDPRGSLGYDGDPELAFAGIRALRGMGEFCETNQVTRLWNAGYSWARGASMAQVSAQATDKKDSGPGPPEPR